MRRIHVHGFFVVVRYLASNQLNSLVGFPQEVISDLVQVSIVIGREHAFLIALDFRLCDDQRRNRAADYFVTNIL
jgi:hypothetical protein